MDSPLFCYPKKKEEGLIQNVTERLVERWILEFEPGGDNPVGVHPMRSQQNPTHFTKDDSKHERRYIWSPERP